MKKSALISVYDKSKLRVICDLFKLNKIDIISTGSTEKYIKKLGYNCLSVSKITNFNEMLEGRVKTLNPKIHGSILFKRNKTKHIKEFKKLKIPIIDFVIVNFYPFEKQISKKLNHDKYIEMIDIGGPTLLRAAAKNYKDVTAISSPNDYQKLKINLTKNKGMTDLKFRKNMALKVFEKTYIYDMKIFNWLSQNKSEKKYLIQNYNKKYLRYGENPHQKSILLKKKSKQTFYDNLIQGKELSFNNLRDIEVAFNCVNEFKLPTSVIVKHCSPCGAASDKDISKAFENSKKI